MLDDPCGPAQFTPELLRTVACDAAAMVMSFKEDDFMVETTVEVDGAKLDCLVLPKECDSIVTVVKAEEQLTVNGIGGRKTTQWVPIPADEKDYETTKRIAQYPVGFCGILGDSFTSAASSIGVGVQAKGRRRFVLSKYPNPGRKLRLVFECLPTLSEVEELPANARKHTPAIVEYMLYVLKMSVADGQDDVAVAQVHRDTFMGIEGLDARKAEIEYRRAKERRLGGGL